MSKDGCCPGSSFATFLTGALLGAVAALLLTTKTGEETRETLAEYGASFKENLPEGIKEKTDEALDRGREYLDEKKKALNEAIEAGKGAMAKEKEDLTTTPDEDTA
jgi:gas vesicle protein